MLFEENYREPGANKMCADSWTQWVEVCIPPTVSRNELTSTRFRILVYVYLQTGIRSPSCITAASPFFLNDSLPASTLLPLIITHIGDSASPPLPGHQLDNKPVTHSTIRLTGKLLDNGPTHLLVITSNLSPPLRSQQLSWTSYPSSAPAMSASSSPSYSLKTVRVTARCLAGSTHSWPAINGGSSARVRMVHAFTLELLWLSSN